MKTTALTPQQLDAQSTVHLHSWVDVDSERHKEIDDNLPFTKKIIRLDFLMIDSLGRLGARMMTASIIRFTWSMVRS